MFDPAVERRRYTDLIIEARRLGDAFSVLAHAPGVGFAAYEVPGLNRNWLDETSRSWSRGELGASGVSRLGERLAAHLIPDGPIRELFHATLSASTQPGGVRLRLVFHDEDVAALPWELMRVRFDSGSSFLGLNPRVSIVRGRATGISLRPRSDPFERALRGVAFTDATARYTWSRNATFDWLDWEPLEANVTPAGFSRMLGLQTDLCYLPLAQYRWQLKESGSDAMLLGRDEHSGRASSIRTNWLATKLSDAGVRVVFLGGFGQNIAPRDVSRIVPKLIERGVPAAVALPLPLATESTTAFNRTVQVGLSNGLSLDEAMTAGRLAIADTSGTERGAWAVPAVYMGVEDGVLFPERHELPSKRAAEMRSDLEFIAQRHSDAMRSWRMAEHLFGGEAKSVHRDEKAPADRSPRAESAALDRYATLECQHEMVVGQAFSVFVQLLVSPPEDNSAEVNRIRIRDRDASRLPDIVVVLRAPAFDLENDEYVRTVAVPRDCDAEVRFTIVPRRAGDAEITADFYQFDRRIGTVSQMVKVTADLPDPVLASQRMTP